ncbi:glycoside hydrolase family 16 protein [Nocardioides nitrophenolicus]|uniref:glycoside hydrolase family 16 protein n=1 Tax=Nocardioides nitrophenolicus TaxID=60489 RepID=UPI001958F3D5|nr:glycoside hydrolase family 16 protein [Nocardioides nitrophenolicus]MBM7518932.1 hypothetical protein [Nocardioides nitrophenolicus]
MRAARMLLALAAALAGLWLTSGSAIAEPAGQPAIERVTPRQETVVFKGRAKPRQVVRLQARGSSYWTTVGKTRASRKGAFRIAVPYPDQPRTYRVVAGGKVSRTRQVVPTATPSPTTPTAAQPDPAKPPAPRDDCGARPERAEGGYYSCTFRDDFDGEALDPARWMAQETWFSGMTTGSGSCYVANDRTIQVRGGHLRLSSTVLPEPFVCKSPYGDFSTTTEASTVVSRSRFTQTYGRFEARLKMPDESGTPGSHSAFWLYPQDHTYGRWPGSGEIDVAEWFSARPANVYPSVHYAGENNMQSTGFSCPMPTSSTEFHDYAVEWTPQVMRFYYDGRLCFTHSWTPAGLVAPEPFDQPFYLVFTQIWGSGWNARAAGMPDTSTLVVDWVKAWQ